MESDLSLINKIKSENDNECLKELIDRHSGVYYYVVDKYSRHPCSPIDKSLLMDEKMSMIYESAIQFDPSRNSKFSTFLANKTRWKCLNKINKEKKLNTISMDSDLNKSNSISKKIINEEQCSETPLDYISNFEVFDIFYDMLEKENDERLKKIIDIRYNTGNNKLQPWRKAAEKVDLSIQGVINIHNKFIDKVNKEINKENTNYV